MPWKRTWRKKVSVTLTGTGTTGNSNHKNMKKLICAAALMIVVAGCSNSNEGKEKVKMTNVVLSPPAEKAYNVETDKPATPKPAQQDISRKIIKEGEISFETPNIAG